MRGLGIAASEPSRVYVSGGASAVLLGWRPTTIDLDLKLAPASDELLRAMGSLKAELELNVELAAPDQFIPELPGWQERSPLVLRHDLVSFHHFDFYAQALAKIERGHAKDLADARMMLTERLIAPDELRRLYRAVEPLLYRYPEIDPPSFREAVERFLASEEPG